MYDKPLYNVFTVHGKNSVQDSYFIAVLVPISYETFHRNPNLIEMTFFGHPSYNEVIAIKFCTWHDNCCRGKCEICSEMIPHNGVTLRPIFH